MTGPANSTLFEPTPRVNHAVPAILRDPDGARDQTWRWSRGDTSDGTFTEIPGATDGTYFPTTDDLGKYLKLDATYKDSNVRDEFPEITPIKTLSVVSDDPVSLYTRTFASSLHLPWQRADAHNNVRGEPNLSQPFRTGPQPEGYMIKKVEVEFMHDARLRPDRVRGQDHHDSRRDRGEHGRHAHQSRARSAPESASSGRRRAPGWPPTPSTTSRCSTMIPSTTGITTYAAMVHLLHPLSDTPARAGRSGSGRM